MAESANLKPPLKNGLRYRAIPVEDDIISSRRAPVSPPSQKSRQQHQRKQDERTESLSASEAAPTRPPAGEMRKRMTTADIDHTKRMKHEYAKKLKKELSDEEDGNDHGLDNSSDALMDEAESSSSFEEMSQKKEQERIRLTNEDTIGTDEYYFARYRVPRFFSRSVESILVHKADESRSRRATTPTLYDVMGVPTSAPTSDIKKTFRQRSLLVHPGIQLYAMSNCENLICYL